MGWASNRGGKYTSVVANEGHHDPCIPKLFLDIRKILGITISIHELAACRKYSLTTLECVKKDRGLILIRTSYSLSLTGSLQSLYQLSRNTHSLAGTE